MVNFLHMVRSFQRLSVSALGAVWWCLGSIIPKKNNFVVLSTYPDFDDTYLSLRDAAVGSGVTLIVLTNSNKPPEADCEWVVVAPKRSLKGIWLYHRSRFVLFTHGLYSNFKLINSQVVVNLWHGSPIKRIGLLDGKQQSDISKSHYVIADNFFFRKIMSLAFGLTEDRVLVIPHPRLDRLSSMKGEPHPFRSIADKLVVWLPTYRSGKVGDVRSDGDPDYDIGSGLVDLKGIDRKLIELDAVCVIKPHPMAAASTGDFKGLQNIIVQTDGDLADMGFSLYQLLGCADMLITDISSVYFDFLSLDRPVALFFPDKHAYLSGRGFVAPLGDLVDHVIHTEEEGLIVELEKGLTKQGMIQRESTKIPPSKTFSARFFSTLKVLHK